MEQRHKGVLHLAARHFQAEEHLVPRIYKYPCYITRFELCFLQPWWKSITAQSLSEYHCRSEMTLSNGCQIFPCISPCIHLFCPQPARRADFNPQLLLWRTQEHCWNPTVLSKAQALYQAPSAAGDINTSSYNCSERSVFSQTVHWHIAPTANPKVLSNTINYTRYRD